MTDAMEIRLFEVMRSLQGITYLQWRKIATAVDASFSARADKQKNSMVIAPKEALMETYHSMY